MYASKRFTLKRPAAALGSYMHNTDVRAGVRVVGDRCSGCLRAKHGDPSRLPHAQDKMPISMVVPHQESGDLA